MATTSHGLVPFAVALLGWCLAGQSPAPASPGRDWFVRAGAASGDGTRAAPFDDPWRALARCEAGDRIHIAAGQYFGRLGRGAWTIPYERVQLLGGYDEQFTTRDPWQHATRLCWNSMSKNWPLYARVTSDQRDVVVDGLVIDMQDQNAYETEQRLGRTGELGESAMQFSQPATVRNCVILNPGCRGIEGVVGATIENNVIVNALVWSIVITGRPSGLERTTATIRGNTVLFSWDTDKPGAGGYGGSAIALRGPAVVADNVLCHSDNAAIYSVYDPARLSITGNVFWKSRFANLTAEISGQRAVITDGDMETIEDVGLQQCADNRVADPGIPFDIKVFETGFAPACSLPLGLGLLLPANSTTKAGARLRSLPTPQFSTATAPAPKSYVDTQLTAWSRSPQAMAGKALQMVIAVGPVANTSSMPAEQPGAPIAGVFLYDPAGGGERVAGFYPKGSNIDRVCTDATGWYQGQGKPDRLHVVRGIVHLVGGASRAAFSIESIERYEPPPVAVVRPQGRDWFVRAGASGGDGSRDKPFRDPFQALERCEAGDSIHVATGEYTGKLKAGRWSIGMPYVTLLGGYDAQFTTRDPWQQPTQLHSAADFQGRRIGYTLEGTGDHTGVVVDGFVFDKRVDNIYTKEGALDVEHSDKIEHLWLSRPGCAVRNCVFMNGASAAVRLTNGQQVSNNVFVNHVMQTVWVEHGFTTDPLEFRDNTVLFAWTKRPGYGHGANGSLLRLCGGAHAVVEGNVFAYADNDAMRIESDPSDVALRNNLFAHNLWSNVQYMTKSDTIDDTAMAQLADLGLKACEGNRVGELQLPIDAAWLAQHQAVRGPTEGKPPEPPPAKPKPSANPFDDAAVGSAPAPPTSTTAAAYNPFEEPGKKPVEGAPVEPFAPAFDLQAALALVVANGEVGARHRELEVAFAGIVRSNATYDYTATAWDVALRTDAWARLDGTRVQIEGAIKCSDRSIQLADISEKDYECYLVSSPDGNGLPLRCYVRRGTKVQRTFDQAKGFTTGKPVELHVVSGVARERRQLVVEAVGLAH